MSEKAFAELPSWVSDLALSDDVYEIQANPDGRVYVDSRRGVVCASELGGKAEISAFQVKAFLNAAASDSDSEIDERTPHLASGLALGDQTYRLQGLMEPIVEGPAFVVRVLRSTKFDLRQHFFDAGIFDAAVSGDVFGNRSRFRPKTPFEALEIAIHHRLNVMVIGAMLSGKTAFLGALLRHVRKLYPATRIGVLEDIREAKVPGNALHLRVSPEVSMADLVKISLRTGVDRLMLGEIRDADAAIHLMDAWMSGHGGGGATMHASSPEEALERLGSWIKRGTGVEDDRLIASALWLIVHLVKRGERRCGRVYTVDRKAGDWRIEPVGEELEVV